MQISLHVKEYDVGDAAASNTEDHPTGIPSSLLVTWLRLLFNPTISLVHVLRDFYDPKLSFEEGSYERKEYSKSLFPFFLKKQFLNPPSVHIRDQDGAVLSIVLRLHITNHKYSMPLVNKEEKSNTNNRNNPILSLHLALFHRTKI